MRAAYFIGFLLSFATLAFAWTKEDHEIFDLVSALEAAEGKGTTFYSFLDVPSTASSADIGKAYRKRSVTMHPDKNSGVKDIEARFARLGVIAKILRNKEDRERYDFFYKNGVPKWRGTGYYYERFRPGLGSVLAFLAILTSGIQHIIHRYNQKRDLERIERFVRLGKAAAYGPKGIPIEGKRKVRVPLTAVDGPEDGGNRTGRMVDLLVDGTEVYLIVPDHEPTRLDASMAPTPRIQDTWAISLVLSTYFRFLGKTPAEVGVENGIEIEESENSSSGDATPNGRTTRQPVEKAGGRRRKVVAKKK